MSTGEVHHLTPAEVERNNQFLRTFAGIEAALQARLGVDQHTPVSRLIRAYRDRNAFWQDDATDLVHYSQIRNFLVHEQDADDGHPVAVSPRSLACLRSILERLHAPRPIREWYEYPNCPAVVTVASDHPLDDVLRLAYRQQFSQFPVVDGESFRGVVTENEITRWLGHQVTGNLTLIELAGVTVRQVMTEREQDRAAIFQFRGFNDAEEEVMGLFHQHPGLEVVLLTENGEPDTPIGGIITQWDAARYPDGASPDLVNLVPHPTRPRVA